MTSFAFTLEPEARELILDKGYSVKENARYLKRAINTLSLQKISNLFASEQIKNGDWLRVGRQDDRLVFKKAAEGLEILRLQQIVAATSR